MGCYNYGRLSLYTGPNVTVDKLYDSDNIGRKMLIRAIERSTKSIYMAMYSISDLGIATALSKKAKANVPVYLVTQENLASPKIKNINSTYIKSYAEWLYKDGVKVKAKVPTADQYALMHHKFAVFDEKIVYVSTGNCTPEGFDIQENHSLYIGSEPLAQKYIYVFNNMYKGKTFSKQAQSYDMDNRTLGLCLEGRYPGCSGSMILRPVFTPMDITGVILQYLDSSVTEIYLSMFTLTHDLIVKRLIEIAKTGGTSVNIILDKQQSRADTNLAIVARLKAAGCNIKRYRTASEFSIKNFVTNEDISISGNKLDNMIFMHAKTMVIKRNNKNPVLFLGSYNYTYSANSTNDENIMIIEDGTSQKVVTERFRERFNTIYMYGDDFEL